MIGGCDIGLSGAIAKMDESGKLISLHDMPIMRVGDKNEINEDEVKELFAGLSHIFFEKAQAMPTERVNPVTGKTVKQGIASTAHYMASYGILRGIAKGMGIPYSLVHPATWKKAMMKDMPKEKAASIARVQQLFPGVGLTRKKDHGKADAALIALYGLNYILLGGR